MKKFLIFIIFLLCCNNQKPDKEIISLMPGLWHGQVYESMTSQVLFDSNIFLYIDKLDGGNVYGTLFHVGGEVIVDGWDLPECYGVEFETKILNSSEETLSIDCFDQENDICLSAVANDSGAFIYVKYGNFILLAIELTEYSLIDELFFFDACEFGSYLPVSTTAISLPNTTGFTIPQLFLTCNP